MTIYLSYKETWYGKGDPGTHIIGIYSNFSLALLDTIKHLEEKEYGHCRTIYDYLYKYNLATEVIDLIKDNQDNQVNINYIKEFYPFFFEIEDIETKLKYINSFEYFYQFFGKIISQEIYNNWNKYKNIYIGNEYWYYEIVPKEIIS